MEIQSDNNGVEEEIRSTVGEGPASFRAGFNEQVQELIRRGSLDFNTWTSIISKIEKLHPDDLEAICSVYDSFLLEFPLCHDYWEKYVAHKARLCTIDKIVDIYERSVKSATYCVSIWVKYCSFGILTYEDPSDIRRLFKRAMSFVGKDYLCHYLWDKYLEFEFSQQQWSFLAQIYVQALKFPTKKLHVYYDNFKKFVDILEEEMKQHFDRKDMEIKSVRGGANLTSKDEISSLIDNLLHPSSRYLRKYISIGERYYRDASTLEKKINYFEANIWRPNFDATPLDDNELENWRRYLDFVEKQGDFDWAVKLYERCLIPCCCYPEFWMRYVEYTESKGGRELAKFALDRATKVFVKTSPEIHLFNNQFKELIGDKIVPSATLVWSENESNLQFIEKVVREANREKRLGNFASASAVYDKALEIAAQRQKLQTVSILYVHFAHLIYLMTSKRNEARDVIINGLKHLPYCKILLEGLINFLMTHGDREQIDLVDKVVADAISSKSDKGLSNEDRQDISLLFLQFVDLYGTIHDIRKVWSRHVKLSPNLIKPSFSDKLHVSENQLMAMEEQVLSFSENHALETDEKVNIKDHAQPEDDITNEYSTELFPENTERPKEDPSQMDEITHDLGIELTQDLVCEVADAAEKGQKCLSLVGVTLNDQETECGDIKSSETSLNVDASLSIAPEGNFQESVPNQIQNEDLNNLSSDNHENAIREQAEMDTHIPKPQGETLVNPTATYSHSQDSLAQIPQFQNQIGENLGYNNEQYNQMMGYYYQQQQMMLQQQQQYMQQQRYMQQIQQQPNNMIQPTHDQQHMLYLQQQQQQQWAQMYYQQPPQTHALLYQQLYQGQQVMTQHDPSSSGPAESTYPQIK